MIYNNNRLFSSPIIPLCSINLLSSFSKSFCFNIVVGCELSVVGLTCFECITSVVSSIEKEVVISVLSLIKCTKISSVCPWTKLFISSFSGVFTLVIFMVGWISLITSLYLFMASFPALSPSKKKTISSNCFNSLIACKCSSVSPFVPYKLNTLYCFVISSTCNNVAVSIIASVNISFFVSCFG